MSQYYSLRDINFHASTEGVRIIATTDVPCHLYCRLSLQPPLIHKKPSYRRGLWLNDDVRFCFTVFEDNEQYETGDTYLHTFWKPDWPVCITKWCYFFASIGGVFCISTSPIFEHHNDGIDPVSPPDKLRTFNSITPEYYSCTGVNSWKTYDASGDISPDATGVILLLVNSDPGQENDMGCRKPGSSIITHGRMKRNGHTWAMCGVDSDMKFEVYSRRSAWQYFYIMGYTGPNVHFLDAPISLKPTVAMVWQDVDLGSLYPTATAALFSLGAEGTIATSNKLRIKGSTDDWWCSAWHSYQLIGVPPSGLLETMITNIGVGRGHLDFIGYITSETEYLVNAQDVTPPATGAWVTKRGSDWLDNPAWVVLTSVGSTGAGFYSGRKRLSWMDELHTSSGGEMVIIHTNDDTYYDLWVGSAINKMKLQLGISREIV